MHRTESEFCKQEAERLLTLAKESDDRKVRDHLKLMAKEWMERARAKDKLPQSV